MGQAHGPADTRGRDPQLVWAGTASCWDHGVGPIISYLAAFRCLEKVKVGRATDSARRRKEGAKLERESGVPLARCGGVVPEGVQVRPPLPGTTPCHRPEQGRRPRCSSVRSGRNATSSGRGRRSEGVPGRASGETHLINGAIRPSWGRSKMSHVPLRGFMTAAPCGKVLNGADGRQAVDRNCPSRELLFRVE